MAHRTSPPHPIEADISSFQGSMDLYAANFSAYSWYNQQLQQSYDSVFMHGNTQPTTWMPVYQSQQFQPAPDATSTYFRSEPTSNSALGPLAPNPALRLYQRQSDTVAPDEPVNSVDQPVDEPVEPEGSGGLLEEKWAAYREKLSGIFQNILNGALQDASEKLLAISDWLLSQVVDLGEYE